VYNVQGTSASEEPSASILWIEDEATDFFKMLVDHISADCNLIIITMKTSNLTYSLWAGIKLTGSEHKV
jgi:hypothetical protein